MTWLDISADELMLPDLCLKDFIKAVKGARPTVNAADNERVSKLLNFVNSANSNTLASSIYTRLWI